MKHYRITFTWKGQRYEEEITASSIFAAKQWLEDRYPGASMVNIYEK